MKSIRSILFFVLIIGLVTISFMGCGILKHHGTDSKTKDEERHYAWVFATDDSTYPLLVVDSVYESECDSLVYTCPSLDYTHFHRDTCFYLDSCSDYIYEEYPSTAIANRREPCSHCNPPAVDYLSYHWVIFKYYMSCYVLGGEFPSNGTDYYCYPRSVQVSKDQLNSYIQKFNLSKCSSPPCQ